MRNPIARFLLIFLIAWLPVSFAHVAAVGCQTMAMQHGAKCMQHAQMHHDKAHDDSHAPSGCHDCALCYSCAGAPRALALLDIPYTGLRTAYRAEHFALVIPEQPERPPRA